MLLAIDTATHVASICLYDGRAIVYEATWKAGNQQTVELAPAIRRAFTLVESEPFALTGLAICTGPGTYTGLRIGVSLAKGLAQARSLPLVGMTALDILAAAHPYAPGDLVTIIQAGRGRVIAAGATWGERGWAVGTEPEITDWPALLDRLSVPTTITGEVDADGQAAIEERRAAGARITLSAPAVRLRRAGFLAQSAWERLREGGSYAAALVTPVYARTKDTP